MANPPTLHAEFIPGDMFPSTVLSDIMPVMPEGYVLRPLSVTDLGTGFLKLLSQLTDVGQPSDDDLFERYKTMSTCQPNAYYLVVVEKLSDHKLVGAATLVIEWKFIHQASSRGRIEDVVVDEHHRSLGLGRILNEVLVSLAKKLGVYKLSLECKDRLIPFYEKFGYSKDEGNNFLVQRFD